MDPRATRRSRRSRRSNDPQDRQAPREAEVWRSGPLGAPGVRPTSGHHSPPVTAPHQRPPHQPADDDIAGLDIFGTNSPPRPSPPPSAPSGRPRESGRDSSYIPAASISGGPRSGPLPLTLGDPTGGPAATTATIATTATTATTATAVAVAPRTPSLTGQLRSVAPPDVARQAVHELGVLAGELEALSDRLQEAGLARTHQRSYRRAALAYVGLAERAWEAVAEERLEQSGAEEDYRAHAIDIARQITHMQRECQVAQENSDSRLSRRRPLLWRRRVQMVRSGLAAWMATVSTPADAQAMGQGLFQLRGYAGLANASALELVLLGALVAGVNLASFLLGWGLVLLQFPTILAGDASMAVALAIGALLVAVVWMLSLVLTVAGRAPLRLQLGATLYTRMHTIRNTQRGSLVLAGFLRGWTILIMLGGVLVALDALAQSALWLADHVPTMPAGDPVHASQLAGTTLILLGAPVGGISLSALLLVALPLLLVAEGRLVAELVGTPSWVPAARRAALRPALAVLGFLTGGLVLAVYAAATVAGLADRSHTLLIVMTPIYTGMVTWRAVLLLVTAVIPYLLLVELPFRLGIGRWRARWLHNLVAHRAALESHMRRLSAANPRSGEQDTSDENLRAMQYDLVLLQFYRSKIEEAEHTPMAPFHWQRVLTLFALGVVLALVVDNVGAVVSLLANSSAALLRLLGL